MNPYSTHLFSLDSLLAIHTREQLFALPLEEPNIRRLAHAHFSTVRSLTRKKAILTLLHLYSTHSSFHTHLRQNLCVDFPPHVTSKRWLQNHDFTAFVFEPTQMQPQCNTDSCSLLSSVFHHPTHLRQKLHKAWPPHNTRHHSSRTTTPPQAKSYVSRPEPIGWVDGTSEMLKILNPKPKTLKPPNLNLHA